jgi:hypothetical protein
VGWTTVAVAGIACLGLFALYRRARGRYAPLFVLDHLVEYVATIDALGVEARAGCEEPTMMTTSAKLAAAYTVDVEGEEALHHLSLRLLEGPTPHVVGMRFLLMAVERLAGDGASIGLAVSAATVHHAEWRMAAGETSAFEPKPLLDRRAVGGLFLAATDRAKHVPVTRNDK